MSNGRLSGNLTFTDIAGGCGFAAEICAGREGAIFSGGEGGM
jgi:hypothetical protein